MSGTGFKQHHVDAAGVCEDCGAGWTKVKSNPECKPSPQTEQAEASSLSAGLRGIVPKRDAVIVEKIDDRFVISIECFNIENEDALQRMAKDILDIAT